MTTHLEEVVKAFLEELQRIDRCKSDEPDVDICHLCDRRKRVKHFLQQELLQAKALLK
jgi:hypothetical protein